MAIRILIGVNFYFTWFNMKFYAFLWISSAVLFPISFLFPRKKNILQFDKNEEKKNLYPSKKKILTFLITIVIR